MKCIIRMKGYGLAIDRTTKKHWDNPYFLCLKVCQEGWAGVKSHLPLKKSI